MSNNFWLDQEHLYRIQQMFTKPDWVARADKRRVLSGISHVFHTSFSDLSGSNRHLLFMNPDPGALAARCRFYFVPMATFTVSG